MKGGRVPYVYLLGASHSGSTLLTLLLNAHPDVATVGELTSGARRNVTVYRCSCRAPILECPFWRSVAQRLRARYPEFDLSDFGIVFEPRGPWWVRRLMRVEHRGPALEAVRASLLRLWPAWRRHRGELEQRCNAIVRAVLDITGASVFVDSSKLPHRFRFIREMSGFEVKVIHLIRDGRGVALTYMDQDGFADAADPSLRRGGFGLSEPPTASSLPMRRAAEEWKGAVRSAEFALWSLKPSQRLEVRYEALCARPPDVLRDVFEFLGLDPKRVAADFRSVDHHVVGNGMRLDRDSGIRLDERWRSVLSVAELAAFEETAGRTNRRYGYA